MNHDKLITLSEKLGLKVEQPAYCDDLYFVDGVEYRLSWYKLIDGNATCVHLVSRKQKNDRDIQSDYFPGFFVDTYKDVKYYLTLAN